MARALRAHWAIHACNETCYFDELRQRLAHPATGPMSDNEVSLCRKWFTQLGSRPFTRSDKPDSRDFVSWSEIEKSAAGNGGSGDALFTAFCDLQTVQYGKRRWAEKTPGHVFNVPEIMEVFPDAQFLCLIRDPRSVVASRKMARCKSRRWRQSYNATLITLMWRAAVAAAIDAHERFGTQHIRLLRYDHLVNDPEETLRDVCQWLGESFDANMLKVPLADSSHSQRVETAGIQPTQLHQWRSVLTRAEVAMIEFLAGLQLDYLGYSRDTRRGDFGRVAWESLKVPYAFLRTVIANRSRIVDLKARVQARWKLARTRPRPIPQPPSIGAQSVANLIQDVPVQATNSEGAAAT